MHKLLQRRRHKQTNGKAAEQYQVTEARDERSVIILMMDIK